MVIVQLLIFLINVNIRLSYNVLFQDIRRVSWSLQTCEIIHVKIIYIINVFSIYLLYNVEVINNMFIGATRDKISKGYNFQ